MTRLRTKLARICQCLCPCYQQQQKADAAGLCYTESFTPRGTPSSTPRGTPSMRETRPIEEPQGERREYGSMGHAAPTPTPPRTVASGYPTPPRTVASGYPTPPRAPATPLGFKTPTRDPSTPYSPQATSTPYKPTQELSLDTLLSMSPIFNEADVVQLAARHLFLSHVRSQACVRDVFFPEHKGDERYEALIDPRWFDFERFAVLYVCQAICEIHDEFKMHTLLNAAKIRDELDAIYRSADWKKIGFALYTVLFRDLVKDEATKVPFHRYIDGDRQRWAWSLSERVRMREFVTSRLVQPVVRGECSDEVYNRDLNVLFVKLHLLDPASVMPTYDHLRKALPDLNLNLVTTNYLGEPLDWTLVGEAVRAALSRPTYPANSSRLSLSEVEVYHGLQVLEFVMEHAKELGLWTGQHPDNRRLSHFRDRCVLM